MSKKQDFIALATSVLLVAVSSVQVSGENQELTTYEYRDFDKGMLEFETQDYDAAFEYWKSLAREGVPEAQYNIGRMHAYGEGVPKNYEEAFAWFLRAEHNGAAEATDALRQLRRYLSPEGISDAKTRATQIARMEAGMEDPDLRPRLYGTASVPEDVPLPDTGG
ncbi:MAG: sel1 repeat family protein [Alphaproteobacteria bacterium]|nr:sel1 repeat family protein [Alphaproteobacteria bacterium]